MDNSTFSFCLMLGAILEVFILIYFFALCKDVNVIKCLLQNGIQIIPNANANKHPIIAKSVDELLIGNKVIRKKDNIELVILNITVNDSYKYYCKELNTNNVPVWYDIKEFQF